MYAIRSYYADGSAIRLTIARYYTPTGRCIQKPYENGHAQDYYSELSTRYLHGEFSEVDSIKFNDSLKYTTPEGKTVYGGGGIMPDLFIPIDTAGVTNYLVAVRNRGLIYRFALEYSDQHRKSFDQLKTRITSYNVCYTKLLRTMPTTISLAFRFHSCWDEIST